MKLGLLTKLDKKTSQSQKILTMTLCRQVATLFSFFEFMANFHLLRDRIPDEWSIKYTFLLRVTFYLTKLGTRIRKSLTQLSYYCFE